MGIDNTILFYAVCTILSFSMLLYILIAEKRATLNQGIWICLIFCANGGYLMLATSRTLGEALTANRVIYASSSFMPMTVFLVICEICRVRIRRYVRLIMYLIQTVIYISACTMGHSKIFYSAVELCRNQQYAYLVKEYGPMHTIYLISVYGYLLAFVGVVIYTTYKGNVVSRRCLYTILGGNFLVVVVFAYERIAGMHVDLIPLLYILVEYSVMIGIHRHNVFFVKNLGKTGMGQKANEGFITLDRKFYFMDCNEYILEIFPELVNYRIDAIVPRNESDFYQKLYLGVCANAKKLEDEADSLEDVTKEFVTDNVEIGGKWYEYSIGFILSFWKRKVGYVIQMRDVTDRHNYVNMIENYNRQLEEDVEYKTKKISEIQQKTILGMAQMVESRDLSTGGHIRRTSIVVSVFAEELLKRQMGFTEKFLNYVIRSAPMHDLGKIAIDDQILRKQGKFTDEEYNAMKKHSEEGAKIVSSILTDIEEKEFVTIAVNVAHYHHEKVNGKGYPEGLKGEEIPIEARIMALADVFDALVSKRCYKEAFTFDRAFEIIKNDAGAHFDEKMAGVFLECREKLEALYRGFEGTEYLGQL